MTDAAAAVPSQARASPFRVLAGQWRAVLGRMYVQFNDDRLMAIAGGVVFYALLALVPAITTLVSLYGLFADPETVAHHLASIRDVIPAAAYGIVEDQVKRAASIGTTQLGVASVAGLLFAMWSANMGTKAIIDALNVVYGVKDERSFVRYNLLSLGITLGAIAVLILVIAAVVAVPLVLAAAGIAEVGWLDGLRWPLLVGLVAAMLAVLYRFGASRTDYAWGSLLIGVGVATVAWLASSMLFSWYLANFANYNAIYGSLGAVVGLMMWMWISTLVILLGAELEAQLERLARQDA
jgi:membrane protein